MRAFFPNFFYNVKCFFSDYKINAFLLQNIWKIPKSVKKENIKTTHSCYVERICVLIVIYITVSVLHNYMHIF